MQADGKIVLGGIFTHINGLPQTNLARLNANGSLDTSFQDVQMVPYSRWLSTIGVQPDGKILVGGTFTTLGGQTRNYLGRLDPDGSLDTGFDPGANSIVSVGALALQFVVSRAAHRAEKNTVAIPPAQPSKLQVWSLPAHQRS